METSAVIMLVFGAVALWGGLILAIVNYQRSARRETGD